MATLDKLLAPYTAAVQGTPTNLAELQQDPLWAALFPQGAPGANAGMRDATKLPSTDGAWNELMIEQPGGLSTGLHLHGASGSLPLAQIARWAESKGFDIGQLLGYGGTTKGNIGTHTQDSWHYRVNPKFDTGEAFDANYYGGGRWDSEQQALNWLLGKLQTRY